MTAPKRPQLELGAGTEALPALSEPPRPDADGYDLVERFWASSWPTLAVCPDDCGTCKPCIAHWAVTWSLAALSNPALVAQAEQQGPWKWTVE